MILRCFRRNAYYTEKMPSVKPIPGPAHFNFWMNTIILCVSDTSVEVMPDLSLEQAGKPHEG